MNDTFSENILDHIIRDSPGGIWPRDSRTVRNRTVHTRMLEEYWRKTVKVCFLAWEKLDFKFFKYASFGYILLVKVIFVSCYKLSNWLLLNNFTEVAP